MDRRFLRSWYTGMFPSQNSARMPIDFSPSFFAHRIFLLSKRHWRFTIPVLVLAVLRLGKFFFLYSSIQILIYVTSTASACATAGQMIRLHSFSLFNMQFRWLFTLGLALSSGIDILITSCLLFLLQSSRAEASSTGLNVVIDLLVRYAFEMGTLTWYACLP
ncbi:hypothetical protein J132_10686 [Termitomyces sp. J132]|nr:hypothetical protein J132_10686 [Termitomyces sp. J132]